MTNEELKGLIMITSGKEYHRHTSYDRREMGGHFLDWANQPSVYKEYPSLDTVSLPREIPTPRKRLSEIVQGGPVADFPLSISVEELSQVLSLTYSLTAKARHAGGEFYYRNVPSAGALYPCELYVAVCSVSNLEDGLYHYSVLHHGLTRLRSGDIRKSHSPDLPSSSSTLLTFFITTIFYRSAWKYRDRSFRYHLLDTGHLLENLVLALNSKGMPLQVDYDFDDQKVNFLLGLDTRREACLAMVRISRTEDPSTISDEEIEELPEIVKSRSQVSPKEVDYPALRDVHRITSQIVPISDLSSTMIEELGPTPSSWSEISKPRHWPEKTSYAEAVLKRRSLRNFVTKPLPIELFDALMAYLCPSHGTQDNHHFPHEESVSLGLLTANIEGIQPGYYLVDRSKQSIGLVKQDIQMGRMAHVCLNQEWLAQAALHFFFLTNLELLERSWGSRGYRYAMITAGRLGQRIYLSSTALGLGCCGIGAFFDGEAASLLELNSSSVMLYLLAAGPVKRIP